LEQNKKKNRYKEIAEYLGKSPQTIKNWKQKSPKLLELCDAGLEAIIKKIDK
jgi:predicted transcriptional regulator